MQNEYNFKMRESDLLQIFDSELPWKPFSGDIYDLLVLLEVFPSKGQAKKNWQGSKNFSLGFNWFERLGKRRLSVVVYH